MTDFTPGTCTLYTSTDGAASQAVALREHTERFAAFSGDVLVCRLFDPQGSRMTLEGIERIADGPTTTLIGAKTDESLYVLTDFLLAIVYARQSQDHESLRPLLVVLPDADERYAKIVHLLLMAMPTTKIALLITAHPDLAFTRDVQSNARSVGRIAGGTIRHLNAA